MGVRILPGLAYKTGDMEILFWPQGYLRTEKQYLSPGCSAGAARGLPWLGGGLFPRGGRSLHRKAG